MTIRGLSGSLLSHDALAGPVQQALAGLLDEQNREEVRRHFRAWHVGVRSVLGPTASARTVSDVVALPLAARLGFRTTLLTSESAQTHALLHADDGMPAVLIVTPWGQDLGAAWRDAVRRGIGHDLRWCFCVNGHAVRIYDATRVYSRRFAEFDLTLALDDDVTFALFWGVLRAAAMTKATAGSLLDRAVAISEQHRSAVRESLKEGVHAALGHLGGAFLHTAGRRFEHRVLDESLIVIYRVLFLLFAEARHLVPQWHPVYREGYTVESLRQCIEAPTTPHGLWEALQAIARLAHRGCHAGTLQVPAFNGRLFSPADAPLSDSLRLQDEPVRRALLALTTRDSRHGRRRIAYADLGVEQLGAVYEHVLDYVPVHASSSGPLVLRPSGRRKATGSFYTPRSLTEYLVRRTLAPLVDGAAPEDVLRLRVADPAMGSGAFLVAACRYLGHAYEQALVRAGDIAASDVGESDRTGFRRTVAQRCLFGVDVNPMAVQLARLSLWLTTLARDRPLTFLDHHLRAGDSIIGASLEDIHRQPPASQPRRSRPAPLPLYPAEAFESGMRAIVAPRLALALEADDTLEQVQHKERTLGRLTDAAGPLARWKAAADLWCAGWFSTGADARTFGALLNEVLDAGGPLPSHVSAPLLQHARDRATRARYFHWSLEFPEIFYGADGVPLERPGFDAVLGNPPWEMLRADGTASGPAAALTRFARGSGIYPLQGTGHANLYQLFIDRALSLLRPHGRLGFIVPSGLATDHGCAALRRHLLERTGIDTFLTFENRDRIFPIHRGLRFTLFTLSSGGATTAVPARAGVRDPDVLDRLPDRGTDPDTVPIQVSLIRRLSGDQMAVPELRSSMDLEIVSRMAFAHPALGDSDGWNVRFGRELNASDDRAHFTAGSSGLPVLEGKHLQPFRVDPSAAQHHISPEAAARLLGAARPFLRPRLAYRDVASPTNRVTLIAAIIPAGVVTTHTLFCVKQPPDREVQQFLCGMFNSFVANYLVRTRVGTHVTTGLIDRLPMPKLARDGAAFREMSALASRLARKDDERTRARHQALAAQIYGLAEESFAHVLGAFPLVPGAEREAALSSFRYIVSGRA